MSETLSLWKRAKLVNAFFDNQFMIIMTAFLSALLSLIALKFLSMERLYFATRFDAWLLGEKLGGVPIWSWMSFLGGLLFLSYFPFITAHFYNRFNQKINLFHPHFYKYLWSYSKRALFFYACVGIPFFIILIIFMLQMAVVVGKIILTMTVGIKIFWLFMMFLLILGTTLFSIQLYLFSHIIFLPLMNPSEEKSYRFLWQRNQKIILKLMTEAVFLFICFLSLPYITSLVNDKIIIMAHQFPFLINNSDYVHLLCLFLTFYANITIGFLISIIISQFYLERIGVK